MDKKKKGFLNYLWYRKIHKEYGIGWLYYFNAIFTMSIFLSLSGTIVLVLHKSTPKIVMPLPILTAAGTMILELFVLVNTVKNKKKYFRTNKKSFLRKIPYFYEIGSIASVVLFTWLQIKAYLAL
jgi:ABC-type nickel/cobalt efflux system permease component RcnA